MRILVTGASGFVGRHTLEPLTRTGAEVHAVSRLAQDDKPGVAWHQADMLDRDSIKAVVATVRPDCVLHMAWFAKHGQFWNAAENLDWAAATLQLARATADAGATRFVGVGTCYEYAFPSDVDINAVCDEHSTELASHTVYDAAKDACRRSLALFCDNNQLDFAWARIFFLYGPHEAPNRLVASIARALLRGEPAICHRGNVVRDYMDVRDAGAALAAVALGSVSGPINIASGEATSLASMALALGRLSGRPELVQIGALPDGDGEPARIAARVVRMTKEVGFQPQHSLMEGLADSLDYWRHAIQS